MKQVLGAWMGILVAVFGVLPGCDWFAQRELKPGVSTKADVTKYMGKPEMMWAEDNGSEQWQFVRGPLGDSTYMVDFDADGKFKGMRNVLTDEYFAKVKPGMAGEDVRRLLGKPSEVLTLDLKKETVWRYRHTADQQQVMMFDVHLSPEGKVIETGKSKDPKRQAA